MYCDNIRLISGLLFFTIKFAKRILTRLLYRPSRTRDFSVTKIFTKERSNIRDKMNKMKPFELNTHKPMNEQLHTIDIHPGHVEFSDLAQKMKPVLVEGLEYITGILGYIEDSSPKSAANDDDNQRNSGKPIDGALLWAHIALYSDEKTEHFDCSQCRGEEHTIQLLDSDTLPGILVACRSLRPGQRGQFLLPPDTMYGELGCPPSVPKSCTVLMIIYSLKWIDIMAPQRYAELNEDDKKDFAANLSWMQSTDEAAANEFQIKKYKPALSYYQKLFEMLKNSEINADNHSKIYSFKIKTLLNVATCQIMLSKPFIALSNLEEAAGLGNCKSNCKYMFTRGRCHLMMHQYEEAFKYLMAALDLEPNNTQIADELLKLDPIITKHRNDEKSLFRNMFTTVDNSVSNFTIDKVYTEDLIKKVCKHMTDLGYSYFPVPKLLLKEEEEILNNVVDTIDNVRIISKTWPEKEVHKYFAVTGKTKSK
ncbi:inactive peptidyl-prolyl cis-trans isomerase FKBP6-like isoform X2 [Arctopsyche grandis]|uniref:inactive peptidyl-prolyl cis-trans isomerase FKBP6-like isoform X2 n=1 Tax=Arctopsyche grandis TaxID=121162 RepID=UPI00406D7D41